MPASMLRFAPALAAALALAGCYTLGQQREAPATPVPQVATSTPVPIVPLPGKLDDTLVFNSNSPEVVTQPGILLSTRPAATPDDRASYLDLPFSGTFQVFSHHIAKDDAPGARLLTLGLIAENRGDRPVVLRLTRGSSYLSQPDALFQPLPSVVEDPEGKVFAGPGDRVATDWLHGRTALPPAVYVLPAHGTALLYNLPVPTDVAILPPINGRTTQLELQSDGPVHLSEVALFAQKTANGFVPPSQTDFVRALDAKSLAGPREGAPTAYDPNSAPPPGKFAYGRVAGVGRGAVWTGELLPPLPGQAVAYPIGTTYLKRMGTRQVQTAPLVRRYPDTAYAAHGNYGVTYTLSVPLENKTESARTFTFALSNPSRVEGQAADNRVTYLDPPNKAVLFRGPVMTRWGPKDGPASTQFTHLVIQSGQGPTPFATLRVPPYTVYQATVTLLYPADSTPPQLLTLTAR